MNIEIKNLKTFPSLSEETLAFTADVWVDGVKRGSARNDGHGGATYISPISLQREIGDYALTLPRSTIAGTDIDFQPTADTVIDALVENIEVERDLTKTMKKYIVFIRDGQIMQAGPAKPEQLAARLARPDLMTLMRADAILNTMPKHEAVAIYKQQVSAYIA